jgi:hypothetical protein
MRRLLTVFVIWTDGREFPKDPDRHWMGYSIGKWAGDTFVVAPDPKLALGRLAATNSGIYERHA